MAAASTHILIFSLHILLSLLHRSQCKTLYKIQQNLPLHDGDVLLSDDENFALGFFSPGNSTRRFIGTWYNRVPELTVFWVANRDRPIDDSSGVLSINSRGDLVVHCCSNGSSPLWSTNVSAFSENATTAQLQNTGNFILLQIHSKLVLWQSFDHPTDIMVPFLKLGLDRKSGMDRCLTSWKSKDDPGPGNFTLRIDQTGYPQLFVYKNGAPHWRAGPWMGLYFSGMPQTANNYCILNRTSTSELNGLSGFYEMKNKSLFSKVMLDPSGFIQPSIWHEQEGRWMKLWSAPAEQCDYYGACGPNSNCNPYNISQFPCSCFPGFVPRSPADWFLRDGSGGCVRSPGVSTCQSGEGFITVAHAKVPDTSQAHVDMSMSLKECEQECLKNCSCTAYTIADESRGGFGCLAWYHDDLLDTRIFADMGQDLYIRVDAVTLARFRKKKGSPGKRIKVAIIVGSTILVLLLLVASISLKKRRDPLKSGKRRPSAIPRRRKPLATPKVAFFDDNESLSMQDLEEDRRKSDFPILSLSTISAATDNFSFINKLGQGGFGSVYKGVLENGREIAVKRLSKSSGQGIEEFKNEVKLIAKLQHRNLVKIWGCCIQEEEKMLIYEYLPNKSLDSFLFDDERKRVLDWRKRFEIASGIARGILYLHEDSRLRIIHRDLKASNVLLDASMNPKISDFGLARICGDGQIEGNTRRVVGTYGYMSPEYAMEGLFSIKSDVYSFGVLLLEIISGKRNSSFYKENSSSNLIGQVWYLWKEGCCLDIVDPSIGNMYPEHEALRCIQIGLLCVQEFAMDRPTMSGVVFMLGNKVAVPSPKQPASAFMRTQRRADTSLPREWPESVNKVSLTTVEAR